MRLAIYNGFKSLNKKQRTINSVKDKIIIMQINISFTDYFMEDDINKTLCYFKKDQSKIFFQNSAKLFILNITNQNVLIVAVK